MKRVMMALAAILLVCMVSIFALTACKITLGEMDGDEYFSGTDKARCVELMNDFFEETLKDPDFVVTCTNKDGVVQYTETVKGTSAYTLFKNGSKEYAFKKGGHFYVAMIHYSQNSANETVEDHHYYCSDSTKPGYCADTAGCTMEDRYNAYFYQFMDKNAELIKKLPEEGATFHGMHHVNWVSNYPTATYEFTYATDQRTVRLTASSEGGKVSSIHLIDAVTGDDSDIDLTWTFVHWIASVTPPDTDAWDRGNA